MEIRVIVVMADEPDRLRIKDQIDRSYCSKTLLIYKKSAKKKSVSPKGGKSCMGGGLLWVNELGRVTAGVHIFGK